MTPTEALEWFPRTRELTKNKNNRELCKQVFQETSFLPVNASTPQRLWHIIYQTSSVPLCKMCVSQVSWDKRYKQYKTYCGSPKCVNNDPDIKRTKQINTNYKAAVEKRSNTNLVKYGHSNFLASSKGKALIATIPKKLRSNEENQHRRIVREKTLMERIGVPNVSLLKHPIDVRQRLNDPEWLFNEHYKEKKCLTQIANELNVAGGATTIGQYLKRAGLTTQTLPARSQGEKQVQVWLESLGYQVNVSVRNIIYPKELDIYLPEHNLAIEYCGLYWHSEQQGKTRLYHKSKMDACDIKGVRLLTLYEDEWVNRRPQVENKILHTLGFLKQPVIHGRKTRVVCVEDVDKRRKFYNQHHLQGDGHGVITLALVDETDNFVAMMTLKRCTNNHYVLNRYATSCRVAGGFSKLVNYFKNNYQWNSVVSFADLRWSRGHLYSTNRWSFDGIIPPDYYYSPDGHSRIHKFNYRRKNLEQRLEHFDSSLSESENCKLNNILRIWDCGKLRFVITNSGGA